MNHRRNDLDVPARSTGGTSFTLSSPCGPAVSPPPISVDACRVAAHDDGMDRLAEPPGDLPAAVDAAGRLALARMWFHDRLGTRRKQKSSHGPAVAG